MPHQAESHSGSMVHTVLVARREYLYEFIWADPGSGSGSSILNREAGKWMWLVIRAITKAIEGAICSGNRQVFWESELEEQDIFENSQSKTF